MKVPERIDLTPEDLAALLARLERFLEKENFEIIKTMVETIVFLSWSRE